jgi:hypothetical protein
MKFLPLNSSKKWFISVLAAFYKARTDGTVTRATQNDFIIPNNHELQHKISTTKTNIEGTKRYKNKIVT